MPKPLKIYQIKNKKEKNLFVASSQKTLKSLVINLWSHTPPRASWFKCNQSHTSSFDADTWNCCGKAPIMAQYHCHQFLMFQEVDLARWALWWASGQWLDWLLLHWFWCNFWWTFYGVQYALHFILYSSTWNDLVLYCRRRRDQQISHNFTIGTMYLELLDVAALIFEKVIFFKKQWSMLYSFCFRGARIQEGYHITQAHLFSIFLYF